MNIHKGEDKYRKILARMLNSHGSFWTITHERIKALRYALGRPGNRERIAEMIKEAEDYSETSLALEYPRSWKIDVDALKEIREALSVNHPTEDEIKAVIKSVNLGATSDGVIHREWVKSVLYVLRQLLDLNSDKEYHQSSEVIDE